MTTFAQKLFLGLALLAGTTPTSAETLSFQTVWEKVKEASPAQEAANLKSRSAEVGLSNAEKHWLPRVYLEAKSYRTNEPGSALFGLLGQRQVGAADFAPDSLNHPEARTYTRGALGVDLALYEGGAKQAQVEMRRHLHDAEKFGAAQTEIEQYAQAGLAYGMMASLKKQKLKLSDLGEQVSKLVKGYRLGQKSNPVGYSGLLGMKSLAIR
nr:TolC family protein [Pseudobdellovibrionaceae bacterium]